MYLWSYITLTKYYHYYLYFHTNHNIPYYIPTTIEMERSTIDEVVLVGGSTRIPRVKQQLR